jgi:hypothetical protein
MHSTGETREAAKLMKHSPSALLTIMVAGALSFGITMIVWGIFNHG